MAKVSLEINGRKYALGCGEGEQERLLRLGNILDERVSAMADQFGQIGDVRLLVMAGITLADELDELNEDLDGRAKQLSSEFERESRKAISNANKSEKSASDALIRAAKRIERLADKLEQN